MTRNSIKRKKLPSSSDRRWPNRLWLGLFALWFLFLSGAFSSIMGSPGIAQAWNLKTLLASKNQEIERLQSDVNRLQVDASALEKSRTVQQREIRRVLGYAAADELIFDFNDSHPISISDNLSPH